MPSVIALPTQSPPLPSFDFTVPLDGVIYTVQMRWNARNASWYRTLLDQTGQTVIVGDTRVVVDWPMDAGIARRTPGALVFTDTSGQGRDPGLADLGTRVVLLYFTAAELGLG